MSAPEGAGSLTLEDPRGPRPPFHRNRLRYTPTAGELVLFPPWMAHSVGPSCGVAGSPRVALSFNVMYGDGRPESVSDWELLADVSINMPPGDGG